MLKDIIIVGASGFGREVAWLIERINRVAATWHIRGFVDDNPNMRGENVGGYPVIGTCEDAKEYRDTWFVCAVGASKIREKIIKRLGDVKYATLIDPSVLISDRVTIGEGSIVCAGSIMTVDICLGKHVIVNLDCTIGHDAILEDYVTLYPSVNVSGMTEIGRCSEIGTGSHIIQMKKIGCNSIVGAGAVVVKDIPNLCTAVGNPAKPIKFFEESWYEC